jgi:pimeloyl-ACP methyl ester carboxylesterase
VPELAEAASRTVDLDGRTHYLDFGGPSNAPVLVAVHGLGGAAWNWLALAPLLRDEVRLIALDLAGHGLSPAAGRPTTVGANQRLLGRFLDEVVGEPAVLVGNSMGGMISVLHAAAAPEHVVGAVLVDPALPRPMLSRGDPRVALQFAVTVLPLIGEAAAMRRRRSLSIEDQIRRGLELCTVDLTRVPDSVIAEGVRVFSERDSGEFPPTDLVSAARSVVRRVANASRLQRAMAAVRAPVLVVHGDKDRLVPVAAARHAARRFPAWRLEVAENVGHVPMLEVPDWTAATILDWLRDKEILTTG